MENNFYFNEDELVKRSIDGDRHYQELLYRKFASKMFSVCLGYAKSREDAKDILQDSFVKVFTSLKKYRGDGSLEGWIRKIIVNTAIDHNRKALKDLKNIEIENAMLSTIEASALENIQTKELLELIHKLPEGARIIFNLYAVEGYNHIEIAEMLNIKVGTSKSQFSRAREILQDLLGKTYQVKTVADYF